LNWAETHPERPLVIKPLASGGNDKVYFCHSSEEIEKAFRTIHGYVNRLGILDSSVLVQLYLRGTQYIVNTVSQMGIITFQISGKIAEYYGRSLPTFMIMKTCSPLKEKLKIF